MWEWLMAWFRPAEHEHATTAQVIVTEMNAVLDRRALIQQEYEAEQAKLNHPGVEQW